MKYKDFGLRFSEACREASPKLPETNEELGKIFGVTAPNITYWRKGQKLPAMGTAQRIAKRCGVCVEWLLTGRGPKYPEISNKQINQAANLVLQALPELADSQLDLLARMAQEFLAAAKKVDD